jgi:hypothetical protein
MIYEYENAIILHFSIQSENNNDHYKLMSELYELERTIFLVDITKCSYCNMDHVFIVKTVWLKMFV